MMPIMRGMNLSVLFEMSLSVPSFLAQNKIIAIGSADAKTIETNSKVIKLSKLYFKVNVTHIIKNKGMHMIGGLVNVDIVFAIFNLFI